MRQIRAGRPRFALSRRLVFAGLAGLIVAAPFPWKTTASLAAGLADADARVHLELTEVRVDGSPAAHRGGEIRLRGTETITIAVACAPYRADARFRVFDDASDAWGAAGPDSVFRVLAPVVGSRSVRITAESADADNWRADTVSLVLRTEPAGAASGSAVAPAGRLPSGNSPAATGRWPMFAAFAGLAVVAGALAAWGFTRRRNSAPSPRSRESTALQTLQQENEALRAQLRGVAATSRDLERANEELREKCGFLEQSHYDQRQLHKRKEEVLAAIAHDIKNPAAAIRQLAEILQSYDLTASQQQEFITDILMTSTRILRLSESLTEVMVMEVRTFPLNLRSANLGSIIEQVCRTNRSLAEKKGITIRHDSAGLTLPAIELDAERIEEALDNLVSNAIKYSRSGTEVKIKVQVTAGFVICDVADTGPGFSESDLQDAFQIGRTLSARPTGGEGSTGLGLWIVRRIAEAHHGAVRVRTELGRGSTFSLHLPLKQPETAR